MDANQMMTDMKASIEALTSKLSKFEGLESARKLTSAADMNSGDIAWMLVSSAFVLFMTLPGLGLFYCGMVREKNVLTTCAQIFTIACLITVLWIAFGYSLCFGPANTTLNDGEGQSVIYGDGSRLWLQGMTLDSVHQLAPFIPEAVFCMFQLTFAIITPALIVGSFADRMKYAALIIFIVCWHLLVYCPIAHSVWHPHGFLFEAGILDFAGGNVVHIAAGVSGLITTLVIGHRAGFKEGAEFEPSNILHTYMGCSMLWFGWFGFNAGSALAANDRAAYAMLMTQIATATASISWTITENTYRKKPSILGMVNGAVAGLVAITPAAGYVDVTGAFIIGLFAGPWCFFGSQLKHYFKYDDALDAFGVHAMGGIIGGLMTGFFAQAAICGVNGVFYGNTEVGGTQFGLQLYGIIVCGGWAAFATFVILKFVDRVVGLRVSVEEEEKGLDEAIHGEVVGSRTNIELMKTISMISSKSQEDFSAITTKSNASNGEYNKVEA